MVDVRNENPLKESDKAYWFDNYGNLRGGQIAEIVTSDQTEAKYAKVLLFREYGAGMMPARLEKCWPTKEACLDAERQRKKLQIQEYADSIKDVNDLVKFMYDTDITSEDRDIQAELAVRTRAMDILGVDLNLEYPQEEGVRVENENPCEVGDEVWWFDSSGNKRNGIITEIYESKTRYSDNDKIATIEAKGITGARLADCWQSEEALLEADHRRAELQIAEYEKGTTDVNHLVTFMFNHYIHSEFRDQEAVAVVEARAKEFLGIDLNEDTDFANAVESINTAEQSMEQ